MIHPNFTHTKIVRGDFMFMLTTREKVLIFLTAVGVSYVICSYPEMSNKIYYGMQDKMASMKAKLSPK